MLRWEFSAYAGVGLGINGVGASVMAGKGRTDHGCYFEGAAGAVAGGAGGVNLGTGVPYTQGGGSTPGVSGRFFIVK